MWGNGHLFNMQAPVRHSVNHLALSCSKSAPGPELLTVPSPRLHHPSPHALTVHTALHSRQPIAQGSLRCRACAGKQTAVHPIPSTLHFTVCPALLLALKHVLTGRTALQIRETPTCIVPKSRAGLMHRTAMLPWCLACNGEQVAVHLDPPPLHLVAPCAAACLACPDGKQRPPDPQP